MKYKRLAMIGLAAAFAVAPVSSASAHDRGGFGRHNPLLLPFVAVGALVAGAAIIATAPIRAVADAADYDDRPRYAPPPQAYAPPPRYYSAYPAYYAPPPPYYAAPRGYYYR